MITFMKHEMIRKIKNKIIKKQKKNELQYYQLSRQNQIQNKNVISHKNTMLIQASVKKCNDECTRKLNELEIQPGI